MWKLQPKTIAILCAAALVTACGKDEPGIDPDNGSGSDKPPVIDPNEQVADPDGTVTISMRNENSGKTMLNDMYIDKADNFNGSNGWQFVNLGAMKGLGNVSYIPKSGYADKVSVTPGNGYVAVRPANTYWGIKGGLYRMYVTGYTLDIAGQIIGAEVKYQEPFKGLDEPLRADETALTFTNDGGSQSIVLNNATIIPFTIQSSAPWCRAVPSSTTDHSFLHDAVTIEVDAARGAEPAEATVTLITGYGKELEIKVTRAGEKSFINLNTDYTEMPALAQTATIGLGANLNASDISVSSDASWCTATLTDNTAAVSEKAAKVKFIDGKPVVESRTGLNVTKSYNLNLAVTENGNDITRRATVTLRSTDGEAQATLVVEQRGMTIEFPAEYADGVVVSTDGGDMAGLIMFHSDAPAENLQVTCADSWCVPTFGEYHEDWLYNNRVHLSAEPNMTNTQRTTTVTISSKSGGLSETVTIIQDPVSIKFPDEYADGVIVSTDGGDMAGSIWFHSDTSLENLQVTCADSWCVPTFEEYHEDWDNQQIHLSVEPNTTNAQRTTTVTISSKTGSLSSSVTIIQDPVWFKIDNVDVTDGLTYYYDRKDHTVSLAITSSSQNWEAESSADWCTLYKNGNTLNVMLTAATEDRVATISFKSAGYKSDVNCKFDINQSKYAVGDSYDEDGLTGTVGYIGVDGTRYIYKNVGEAQWSTQTIETGANSRTDGMSNMNGIKRIPNWETLYPAFALCEALNTDGITGWYIPSLEENKKLGISTWTSTEYIYSHVLITSSVYGVSSAEKTRVGTVYAIHKF